MWARLAEMPRTVREEAEMTATAGTGLKRPDTMTPIPGVPRQLAPERPTTAEPLQKGRGPKPLYARRRRPVLLGALVVALAGATVATVVLTSSPSEVEGHMGLSQQAWQEYRAGERSGVADQLHMGLTQQDWRGYRAGEVG